MPAGMWAFWTLESMKKIEVGLGVANITLALISIGLCIIIWQNYRGLKN
jgi:hypothetical protein